MSVGQTIDLTPININAPEMYISLMKRNYPDGLTSHGITYYIDRLAGESDSLINTIVESVFEHTRQMRYPFITSRFQSIFAAETLEDAKKMALGPKK